MNAPGLASSTAANPEAFDAANAGRASLATTIALLGNPNCGKSALFNLLTGARQKVANYAGVTVERKEGQFTTPAGHVVHILDLPGTYSLHAISADEAVTRDVILGRQAGERRPDLFVCVTDATNLRRHLRLVLEAKQLGLPLVIALNLSDVARDRGIQIDVDGLSREIGVPIVNTVAVHGGGADGLLQRLDAWVAERNERAAARASQADASQPPQAPQSSQSRQPSQGKAMLAPLSPATPETILRTQKRVRALIDRHVAEPLEAARAGQGAFADRLDRILLHPVLGWITLVAVMFLLFQAVFSWAEAPMGWIEAGVAALGEFIAAAMPEGPLRSLLVDGLIAGVGAVLVFLPQILILFAFILALEACGYLPRAAFLLDRPMSAVGLTGRSFIPLLSSFACAVPGIMATRSIPGWRDRLATIMIAPLMTCSARLPVYALLIGAFFPDRTIAGLFNLRGVVLFVLYFAGIAAAIAVAGVMRLGSGARIGSSTLVMELPDWRWPSLRDLLLGLKERALIFLRRVGGIILTLTILLWFLSSYPAPPEGAPGAAIQYSFAGRIGSWLELLFAPIGFNWQISVALVPGMAAREVVVGALGTVYALSATGDDTAAQLAPLIAQQWSIATACSLLAWFVFAPQCISTLSIVRRETQTWRYPLLMAAYLFGLAWIASFVVYRIAVALGWGG